MQAEMDSLPSNPRTKPFSLAGVSLNICIVQWSRKGQYYNKQCFTCFSTRAPGIYEFGTSHDFTMKIANFQCKNSIAIMK